MNTSVLLGTFIAAIALLTSNVEAKPMNQENDMKTYKALRQGEEAPVDAIGLDQLPDTPGLLRVYRNICEPIAGGTSCESSKVCEQNVNIPTWSVPRPADGYFFIVGSGWSCNADPVDGDFALNSYLIYDRFKSEITMAMHGKFFSETIIHDEESAHLFIESKGKIPKIKLSSLYRVKDNAQVTYSVMLSLNETVIQP